jgi:hypothetical protein
MTRESPPLTKRELARRSCLAVFIVTLWVALSAAFVWAAATFVGSVKIVKDYA